MEWVGAHSSPTDTSGEYGWLYIPAATLGLNQWLIDPGSFEDFFDEPTLVRQIIQYTWMPVTISVPASNAKYGGGWIGIIVTAGDGAVPDPSIDARRSDYDWAFWAPLMVGCATSGATTISVGNVAGANGQLDIRSKRKIRNGHGLAFYFSPSDIMNIDCQFEFQWRGLFAN